MRSKPVLAVVLAALSAGLLVQPAHADPPGTISLSERTVPSVIAVRAASEAGLAYETDSALGGASSWWLKARGADPVRLGWTPGVHYAMAGRMVFDYTGQTVRYSTWNGPVRSCPVYPNGGVQFIPTGWAYVDRADGAVKVVTATDSGCTTRTFLAATADLRPQLVYGGDANGLVVESQHAGSTDDHLGYHRNSDPAHPVALDTPAAVFDLFGAYDAVRGGAVLVIVNSGPGATSRTWRVPLDGSAAVELPGEPAPLWDAATTTATAVVDDQGLTTIPAAGGTTESRAGVTGDVVSDGTVFYTSQGAGEAPGIYARTTASGAGSLVVARPDATYPTEQWGIALAPGRVFYASRRPTQPGFYTDYDVRTRAMTTGPGTVSVGPEQTVGTPTTYAALSASAGRLVFDGKRQRSYTGSLLQMNTTPAALPEMSGNRWLIGWSGGSGADVWSGRTMYDVKTGKTAADASWPQGPQDLFGNYLLYARDDGSLRLRNLVTGTETVPRGAGTKLGAVALHARWAAWVTACRTGDADCAQTLTVRDLSTGVTRNYNTRRTFSLDLSGGYLAFDATWTTSRVLRTVRADTGAVQVIGSLPAYVSDGARDEGHFAPRHFDVEDEVVGWLDQNHAGRLAHLAPTIDPPRYLGNVIAASSFSTTWSMALPVSKALKACTVTIYRGSTAVRILNCANTTGMVAVTWDGRAGSGAALPAGTYAYRVSGTDDDGYWMRNYDGTLSAVSGTIRKTA